MTFDAVEWVSVRGTRWLEASGGHGLDALQSALARRWHRDQRTGARYGRFDRPALDAPLMNSSLLRVPGVPVAMGCHRTAKGIRPDGARPGPR